MVSVDAYDIDVTREFVRANWPAYVEFVHSASEIKPDEEAATFEEKELYAELIFMGIGGKKPEKGVIK